MRDEVVDQPEHLDPAAASGDRPLDAVAVEDRPDPVAVAGQDPGQRRDEVDEDAPLLALGLDGPEVDRRAEVEQEPGRDLAVLEELPDVRCVHPGRDVQSMWRMSSPYSYSRRSAKSTP